LAVLATITLLRIVDLRGLEKSIKTTFSLKRPNRSEPQHLVSLLIAAGYISRSEQYLVAKVGARALDFEQTDLERIMASATLYYSQHFPIALEQLRRVSGDSG